MPTYILFILCAIILALCLAVIIMLPWFRYQAESRNDNQLLALNIDVFKQRLAELENDFNEQQIDQATYDSQKLALERQLLDINQSTSVHSFVPNFKSRLIFIIWIPFLVAMAYYIIADRSETFKLWQSQDHIGKVADDLLTGKISTPPESAAKDAIGLINTMQTNVHHNATDPMRWFRMSEIYMALEAPEQALEALARAYRLNPDDEKIAITYAQTSFFAQGGVLSQNIRQVLQKVLANNPTHQGAQMLMVMGEMKDGNYAEARKWLNIVKQAILAKNGDHSEAVKSLADLEKNINEREAQSKQAIIVQVNITPTILGRVKKGDTLFVNIRPIAGGVPVVAKKISADDLHKEGLSLKISDIDSIMPTALLSQAIVSGQQLGITARVSTSGDAMPQSGDLTSNPVPLDVKANSATVLIDKVVP
ncbi:c-type cytochrome biogenesis protein CcmI [Faucicola mancuniensis]|uniref:c-type cytochrome biogenesis protein CcmI n=1 Tax=Faucicola mancuniensis TaxID=1309795 RepID=UPI0039778286